MPYVTKQAQDRVKWMTLVEAVDHVMRVDRCGQDEALRQLRSALSEEAVASGELVAHDEFHAVSGKNEDGARWGFDGTAISADEWAHRPVLPAWSKAGFWKNALIDLEDGGRVVDDPILICEAMVDREGNEAAARAKLAPFFRPILLRRADVLGVWPEQSAPDAPPAWAKATSIKAAAPMAADEYLAKNKPEMKRGWKARVYNDLSGIDWLGAYFRGVSPDTVRINIGINIQKYSERNRSE